MEGYDASYADYYYQQEEGYPQEGYEGYYTQGAESAVASDPYHYSYDTGAGSYPVAEGQNNNYYDAGVEGQAYSYYDAAGEYDQQEYATETPETWTYSPEEGQQLYLDQLTIEQTAAYYYDEYGNLVDGYGGGESPANVFTQEAYWESGAGGSNNNVERENTASPGTREGSPQDETSSQGLGLTESSPLDSAVTEEPESSATPDSKSPRKKKTGKNGRATSPSRKQKSRKERIEKRQALLEKEEEERTKTLEAADAGGSTIDTSGGGNAVAPAAKLSKKKTGFVDREKAKFQMKLRIAKAIKRNRMPVQIRILPTDSLWLPKFVDDLIRGIVRYKIKIFKDPPKKLVKEVAKPTATNAGSLSPGPAADAAPAVLDTDKPSNKPAESTDQNTQSATKGPSTKKSLLQRSKTENANRKLSKEDKANSSKSLS
ncbi:unnamed protein product [Phytophthora lilii]|uniref:Unnamed protein product n=1 Tax=Phytophthora lilii TaxID=2077276 RepID=A0A9W6WMB0_9STRA|nr:unnamed protein product [Phytophthora lilii]